MSLSLAIYLPKLRPPLTFNYAIRLSINFVILLSKLSHLIGSCQAAGMICPVMRDAMGKPYCLALLLSCQKNSWLREKSSRQ
jgi:hypothetical protein